MNHLENRDWGRKLPKIDSFIKKVKSKNKNKKRLDTREFLNLIIDEEQQTIQLADTKEYIGAIAVSPINIFGVREKEQTKFINVFESFVNNKKFGCYQIYSSETGSDTNAYTKQLNELQRPLSLNSDNDRLRFELIENEKKYISMQTSNHDLVDKYFYIIFKHSDKEELDKVKHDAMYLLKSVFSAREVDYYEHIQTIYRYFNPFRSLYEKKEIGPLSDLTVGDYISPTGVAVDKNKLSQYIYVDDVYCKTFHVFSYPDFPFFAWLSYLTGFNGVDFSLHVEDCDSSRLMKTYDKQYNNICKNYDKATKRSEQEKLKNDMESVELMIESLSRGSRKSVSFVVTLRIAATSIEKLNEMESSLIEATGNLNMLVRQGFFDQKNLFYSTAPLCCNTIKEYTKDAVCNVLSWGFPFVFESLNDQNLPILIGRSRSMGGAIFYNHLVKSKSRTNSNEVVFGTTGSGKTYFLMLLILHRFARGMKQIIVDVEGKQMNKLTKYLGGEVINCSNGVLGIINPLQIRITIDDDDSGDKIPLHRIYPLASHIQFLRTFFGMYFTGLDRVLLSEVEDALEELYKHWGYSFETTAEEIVNKEPKDFPIMKDLYEMMVERFEKADKNNLDKKNRMEIAKNFIKRMAVGADSPMFNGHTNISLDNDTICFNLAGLQNKDTTVLRTQYYNILSYVLTEVISGKFTKWIQIYEDECHVLMNKNMPEVMQFQKLLIKVIRKYNGGLTTSTQEIADMLNDSVKEFGAALLGNSNYKFFFKQEAESIQYLKSSKIISDKDADYLQYAEIGQCHMSLGANALQIEVVLPDACKELFDSFLLNETRS